jgi:hypothetical protein
METNGFLLRRRIGHKEMVRNKSTRRSLQGTRRFDHPDEQVSIRFREGEAHCQECRMSGRARAGTARPFVTRRLNFLPHLLFQFLDVCLSLLGPISDAPAGAWRGCASNDSGEVASWVMGRLQGRELRTNPAAGRSGSILARLLRYRGLAPGRSARFGFPLMSARCWGVASPSALVGAPSLRPLAGHQPSTTPITRARHWHGRHMRRASWCRSDGCETNNAYHAL